MTFNERSSVKEIFKAAARNGQLEGVIQLSKKRKLNSQLVHKALLEACTNGHKNFVQWLMENTAAEINYKGKIRQKSEILKRDQSFFFTPTTAACYNDHLDLVKYLVEICHAEVNLVDEGSYTPLICACHRGNYSVSMYLINKLNNSEINFAHEKKLNTALHYAVWCAKQNRTPLHEACKERNVKKVMELVIVKGHNINAQDNSGWTPLHTACYYGFGDVVSALMMAGADETITDEFNKTPEQVAEKIGHHEILKLLDRVSLWSVMQRIKITIPIGFLTILTLQLMRRNDNVPKISLI